jgi:hypothetical protein
MLHCSHSDLRFGIFSQDKYSINRPFIFAFERFQVVGDSMFGWSGAEQSPSSGKERRFEVGSSQGEPSKHRAVDLGGMIDGV